MDIIKKYIENIEKPIFQSGGTWEKQQAKMKAEKSAKLKLLLQENGDIVQKLIDEKGKKKQEPIKTQDATRVVTKFRPEIVSKTARNMTDKEIAEERKAKIEESVKYQDVPFTKDNWRDVLAKETQSTGDKFRVSLEPNFFDDYLNPAVMIGDMASNLGQSPLQAQQSDSYLPYVTAFGTPLAVGAMAGIGTQNTGQFVNNLTNPLAGTGDLVNNLGNKYLPNAYKLNPYAFKASEDMGYRMLGKEGYQDAIESGVLRAKPIPNQPVSGGISLSRNTNRNPNTGKMQPALDRPYFADGFIDERYAADYMAAVNKAGNNLVPIPTHKGIAPAQAGNIPLENATLYKKDWLKGYKQVEVPKTTQNFKSEINWGQWNKEIPENPQLMKEYNAIEQTSKANNTWMKNPDGSSFQGTPEQFVQQNSQNFKKAFGNVLRDEAGNIRKTYHGSPRSFDVFDPTFQKRGNFGKGIYTSLSKDEAKFYTKNFDNIDDYNPFLGELYQNVENPIVPDDFIYNQQMAAKKKYEDLLLEKGAFGKDADEAFVQYQKELDNVKNLVHSDEFAKRNRIAGDIIAVPYTNYPKSAVGNVGFFDMTNPNIYKSIAPIAGATYLATQGQEEPKKFQQGGKFTENEKKFLEELAQMRLI